MWFWATSKLNGWLFIQRKCFSLYLFFSPFLKEWTLATCSPPFHPERSVSYNGLDWGPNPTLHRADCSIWQVALLCRFTAGRATNQKKKSSTCTWDHKRKQTVKQSKACKCILPVTLLIGRQPYHPTPQNRLPTEANGAFRLFDSVRHGSLRHGSVRFAIPLQFSTALEWAGLFTYRHSCATSTWWLYSTLCHHHKRATNKYTTKEHIDGIVFFILDMWMFLTATDKPMRMLGIYPQQQRLWWQCHRL